MKSQPLSGLDELMTEDEMSQAQLQGAEMLLELNLAEIRHSVQMSQVQVASCMGIKQPTIANLEKNGKDVKLLSLKRYVEALGGKLRIDIEMPNGHHFGMKV
ncbi:helix-turn-helix transcriptional regulator [Shewanella sairae]|uniref:helix-turn-helix domain-containing protein n=1 Tax=Shewanella sairae TaxID=190310 RepID=UPI00200D0FBF|nr:helix-turn-helix transcriptional regulator [Shewanella sairae]MCL1132538.1 helix-turn-helix transcriptional regulator [Shewanella sairae]